MQERKIIHVDMDAFYASIEQRDNPELKGKPVAVGGSPQGRGVVAAASYEAREFGVRSAMPAAEAKRRCRDLIFVRPRIHVYKRVSNSIFGLLRSYTDLVEPLSLDEAYMDVTRNKRSMRYASHIAKDIRYNIRQFTGLSASCGVANSKFLAKVASDLNKPDGMSVILPENVLAFLDELPIRKVPGIGPKTEEKLLNLGFRTAGSFRRYSLDELKRVLGNRAEYYYEIGHGRDQRKVRPNRERKSIGAERTFLEDTNDLEFLQQALADYVERIQRTLLKKNVTARTVTLKARYPSFETVTRSKSLVCATDDPAVFLQTAYELLEFTEWKPRKLRLLGLSVSGLVEPEKSSQMDFQFE